MRAMAVSRDSPWSHVAWMQALDLNFPLLSDWNGDAVRGFGIARDYRGMSDVARRSAFLIDAGGTVRGAWALRGRRSCRTSTSSSPRRGRCRTRPSALSRRRPRLDLAGAQAGRRRSSWPKGLRGLPGAAAPGDHLQATWQLWLPGHQLGRGESPIRDPYSFRPEAEPRVNFAGWPFGLPFWPLHALLGSVGAWNVFVLLGYVGAGGLTFLWLRSLGLPRRRRPRRRRGVRARPLPRRPGRCRPSARLGRDAAAALAVGVGTRAVPRCRRGIGLDSALRPGTPGARCDPVRRGVHAAARRRPPLGRRRCGGLRRGRLARLGALDPRLDRRRLARSPRSSATRPSSPTSSRAILATGSRRSSCSAGSRRCSRSQGWRCCARGSALILGLGAAVPCLLALGANLPGYESALGRLPGLGQHARARRG